MLNKFMHWFVIGTFVMLYLIVSIISTIHVVDFFRLSNPNWLAISLAVAFEIGAAASLASLIVLDKTNKGLVWFLFILLTGMQMMGNSYYAYSNLGDFQAWIELFGLVEEDPITQKRILSIISGAILPIVALGFIKSLVDYIKPHEDENGHVIIDENSANDNATNEPEAVAIGDMESEVDRLLSHKDDKDRDVIKNQLKDKILELANKEAQKHAEDTTENKEEISEINKENVDSPNSGFGKKPNNKRRPAGNKADIKKKPISNKPSEPHYRGGST